MMDHEDLGERRQVNHTPTIALGIAALLLLIVGAMSYRDFVRTSYEKEYSEKERQLLARHGYQVAPFTTNGQQAIQGRNPNFQQPQQPQGNTVQQVQQPQLQAQPTQAVSPALVQNAATMQIESSLPQPLDPEIDSIRNSLEQVREQSRRTEEQFLDIAGNMNSAPETGAQQSPEISEELPDFLRNAVENPPGGNPEVEERLARMRNQVLQAPSLARVTGFDDDWGIVTFNAGASQNVRKDQRFAVRRGGDILGWIKVDEVQQNQSIAILVTNRDDETVKKPEVGDDLIDFELF
ncbi:MAG: hypothetical protein P1U58_04290 [Verrucomicrobiales bacterium]|nr:hypothetical protein [Verrucomicrobiales bacterium]